MDVAELVSRCKAGDRQAMHLLYQQYSPRLLQICRQYAKDDDVAKDLLHDAFVIILTSFDKLRSADRLVPWMSTIVRNVGCHYCKHVDKEQTALLEMADEDLSSEETMPLPDYEQLQAFVNQLPEGYQQVFKLSVFEGLSHQEIAQKLGIAPHSSSSQLSHAKRRLQQLVKQWWMLILLLIAIPTAWRLFYKTASEDQPMIVASDSHETPSETTVEQPHEEPTNVLPAQQTVDKDYPADRLHRLAENTPASEPQDEHSSDSLNGRSSESRESLLSLPSREVRRTKFNSPKVCQSKKDSSASLNSLKVCQSISLKKEVCQFKKDSYGRICGLHPEDAALIAQLWDASGHRGIHIRTLAAMYFPDAANSHCAVAQLSYELRCCHGLTEALERLHHPKQSHRFTCAQVRQIFLLYGSPGA